MLILSTHCNVINILDLLLSRNRLFSIKVLPCSLLRSSLNLLLLLSHHLLVWNAGFWNIMRRRHLLLWLLIIVLHLSTSKSIISSICHLHMDLRFVFFLWLIIFFKGLSLQILNVISILFRFTHVRIAYHCHFIVTSLSNLRHIEVAAILRCINHFLLRCRASF